MAIFASPSAAVACAVAVRDAACGIHTAEIERHDQTVRGFAVDLAGRLATLAAAGEVILSRTVRDLTIGSSLRFGDRGRDGEWDLFTPA